MKRGVFLILVVFILILTNSSDSLTCNTNKGIRICDKADNPACVAQYDFYCTLDNYQNIEAIMGAGYCCTITGPTCSDGIQNQGETGVDCEGPCQSCYVPPVCGNGKLETGEQCDDGNTRNGDGCSSICTIEPVQCSGSWYDVAKCICEKQNTVCTVNDIWKRWGESSKYPGGLHYYYNSHNDGCSSGTSGDIKEELSGCNEPCRGRFDLSGNIQLGASCGTPPPPPPPRPVCDNGICESGEDCNSCSRDCGSCCNLNYGQICTSQPNNCGQTNTRTYDCNGVCSAPTPPDAPLQNFYRDADSDNYGNPSTLQTACTQPAGYVINNQDCNDNNRDINPGKQEICTDGIDNNCNGLIDCKDSACTGKTNVGGKTCCINTNQCSFDQACENNVCQVPSKIGNPTCCLTYTECLAAAAKNSGNKLAWPQSVDCVKNGITERPECY